MLKLFARIALLGILATCAAWLAGHPGEVTIYWLGHRADTSVGFLLALAAAGGMLAILAFSLLRRIVLTPGRWRQRRTLKQYRLGFEEITASVAALAASDAQSAGLHTRRAEKYLGKTPLTLLLAAQVARSEGNDEKTRVLLESMLEHEATEYLAARSLSEQAMRQNQPARALDFAQRAMCVNPKEKAAAQSVVSLHCRMQEWEEALAAVQAALRKRTLSHQHARHLLSVIYTQYAEIKLAGGQPEAALPLARQAVKEDPLFLPAALAAVKAMYLSRESAPAKGFKLAQARWKRDPNPELAVLLLDLWQGEPQGTALKKMRALCAANPANVESHIALARAAIACKDWDAARKAAKAALACGETMRVCKLMAEIEQGEFADFDAAGKWHTRAATAAADPAWGCGACGQSALRWHAHCPSCGSFDRMEWRTRQLQFAGQG